jgi:hypothetical protein
MTEKLKQKSKEEIEKLPKEIQEAINSFDWGKISEEISTKYFLDESSTNNLQVEILLVLTGIEQIDFLETNIENNVQTSKESAIKIADELLEKVFIPIDKKIKEKIQETLKNKKPTWDQNVDFIVSGGDYSVFLRKTRIKTELKNTPEPEKTPINYSKIEDLKNNFTI